MSIDIKDGNGVIQTFKTKEIEGEQVSFHCSVPSGSIDNYLSKFAEDLTDGGNEDANKDYSVTPGVFTIAPPAGEIWYIARMIVYIEDTGTFDSGQYGNGVALANGITIKSYRNTTEKIVFTNSQPITKNTHWKKFCYDIDVSTFGTGNESLGARWTFTKGGTYIKLDGDESDRIEVRITDDLSGLVSHTFLFQGYKD